MNYLYHYDDLEQYLGFLNNIQPHTRLIIDFSATWCNPCKKLFPYYEKLASQYPNIVFVHLDFDKIYEHPEFTNYANSSYAPFLSASAFPTIVGFVGFTPFEYNGKTKVVGFNLNELTEYIKGLQSTF